MAQLAKPRMSPRLERFSPTWPSRNDKNYENGYELIDTGSGRKLERFGPFTLIRPEPQAAWPPALPDNRWADAHGAFVLKGMARKGDWQFSKPVPSRWTMRRDPLEFWVQPTPSGHLGVFPDQACHWDWISERIQSAAAPVDLLCLFGYTGLASLAAAAAGARVTHLDASRKAVSWARENQQLSGLSGRPVRWIVDDALAFVTREVKRGRKYNALLLDPPRFGRGPQGEIWKLADSLPVLLRRCRGLLATPLFVVLNSYTTVLTRTETPRQAAALHRCLQEMLEGHPTRISSGELVLADSAGRHLSSSVFARAAGSPSRPPQ